MWDTGGDFLRPQTEGDKILVARNCHKAVYHGIYLRQLKPVYIYPDITRAGIQGQIRPDEIEGIKPRS